MNDISINDNFIYVKNRIFLSYGHDVYAENAVILKSDFEKCGFKVWFDLERIREGRDWEHYIEDGLRWCNKVVLLMTPHSVRRKDQNNPKSTDGFCLNELALANYLRKDIIPVLLVELHQASPLSIVRIQYLDLCDSIPFREKEERYKSKFSRLVKAIEQNDIDFEGNQSTLIKLLQPLDFRGDVREHVVKFCGRDWLLKTIHNWLYREPDDGQNKWGKVFWLRGNPGTGKTAISAYIGDNWAEIAAYHFCSYDREYKGDPNRLILSLAYQLSQAFPEYQNRLLRER
ncbi:MAG: toll/interleukin-1 receptor domain-containing protein, partial [Methanolinea sp.]|nr:toll/interleukin-1 receptor domain-containing protein [Methanolinea sp.]